MKLTDLPSKGASPFASMEDIIVDRKGVAKLLDGLIVLKTSGLDGLITRMLKECSNEISPILAPIFNESLAPVMYQMTGNKQMLPGSLKKRRKI